MSLEKGQSRFRSALVSRLMDDLVGPQSPDEVLTSRPTDVYLTGILYPTGTGISPEEDDSSDRGGGEGSSGGVAAEVDDQVPLVATMKPSSAGLSFSLEAEGTPSIVADLRWATYLAKEGTDGRVESWRRQPHFESVSLSLNGTTDQSLSEGKGRLFAQVSPWGKNRFTVTVAFVNDQEKGDSRRKSEERTFFQVEMTIRPGEGSRFVARPSRRVAQDEDERSGALIYRDAKEIATGHTCAAEWERNEETGEAWCIRTAWLPRATVAATSPNGDVVFRRLAEGHDRLSATWLASAPGTDLDEALQRLVACYREWIEARRRELGALAAEHRTQAEHHLKRCSEAGDRMAGACKVIASDDRIREAFQKAQQAMVLQRRWSTGDADIRWRPFQLAFQLLVLPSLADREHPDRAVMDLLWFPTGGGKTEAYLALTAFVLFLRRLRGDRPELGDGVAVLMRYTLRLLTVQQFQRAAAMVCACELLRRRAGRRFGDTPFSIGLWVGNNATPGDIESAIRNDGTSGSHRQLSLCPCCRQPIEWKPDRVKDRCQPKCIGESACELRDTGAALPIWTVDTDIYREAPSLLLATVDKFAQIVRKTATGTFFAIGKTWDPLDLIIQDELHLISGPLGSMTGLYETAIDELIAHRGTYPKVIGSTATIRRAQEQVRALFKRDAFQFPPPGIDARDSGFAVRDEGRPGRDYLGITTTGRSAKFVVQAVAAAILQAGKGLPAPSDDVRDPYWTLVAYFNTLRELGGSIVLMQDDVPFTIAQFAERHAEEPRRLSAPAELTSRVSSTEIVEMLQELEHRCGSGHASDTLLASNMISVGVDIPRLGVMVVVGQPKTIAEYIQATSRVGRSAPGLVVAIYNAGRARDRARFETFKTWHETLYREVEATSVTPFASRAQDKALHATLVALVRHLAPGMADSPVLNDAALAALPSIVKQILDRVEATEPGELEPARKKLEYLTAQWMNRELLKKYWDDFGDSQTLLLSAEQWAASKSSGADVSRALWPTPNSMREVEPATPFKLVHKLANRSNDASE